MTGEKAWIKADGTDGFRSTSGGVVVPPEPERTCTVCGEPVILAYMGGNPEPVDTLHGIRIGEHDHDAVTDMSDVEDALYGQPPAGWAE